ncbi:formyltetrahydrofolate deformylase, partial [Isoptericola sp. MSP01]
AISHTGTGDLAEGPIIEQEVERVDASRAVRGLLAVGADAERRTLAGAGRRHAELRVLPSGRRTDSNH